MRFAEVHDPYHAFTMIHKAREVKVSLYRFMQRLYALANDAFAKVDKVVVESQLVGFFIDGVYYDFLCIKVMRENISGNNTICIGRTKFARDFN